MAATRQDIQRWFEEGVEKGATHMIVICDTYDWEDYPVYVSKEEDVRKVYDEWRKTQRVMEVYSLKMSMADQMNEHRAFHFD